MVWFGMVHFDISSTSLDRRAGGRAVGGRPGAGEIETKANTAQLGLEVGNI